MTADRITLVSTVRIAPARHCRIVDCDLDDDDTQPFTRATVTPAPVARPASRLVAFVCSWRFVVLCAVVGGVAGAVLAWGGGW